MNLYKFYYQTTNFQNGEENSFTVIREFESDLQASDQMEKEMHSKEPFYVAGDNIVHRVNPKELVGIQFEKWQGIDRPLKS